MALPGDGASAVERGSRRRLRRVRGERQRGGPRDPAARAALYAARRAPLALSRGGLRARARGRRARPGPRLSRWMAARPRAPLAPLTTLHLGGPAREIVEARSEAELVAAVRAA